MGFVGSCGISYHIQCVCACVYACACVHTRACAHRSAHMPVFQRMTVAECDHLGTFVGMCDCVCEKC